MLTENLAARLSTISIFMTGTLHKRVMVFFSEFSEDDLILLLSSPRDDMVMRRATMTICKYGSEPLSAYAARIITRLECIAANQPELGLDKVVSLFTRAEGGRLDFSKKAPKEVSHDDEDDLDL